MAKVPAVPFTRAMERDRPGISGVSRTNLALCPYRDRKGKRKRTKGKWSSGEHWRYEAPR